MGRLSSRISNIERQTLAPAFLFVNRPVRQPSQPFSGFHVVWPNGERQEYRGARREAVIAKIHRDARNRYSRGVAVIQYFEISGT